MKMSPLTLLETSIIKGDWGGVCEVYKVLTGKTLKPISTANNSQNDEVVRLLNEALALLQGEVEPVQDDEIIPPVSKKTNVKRTRPKRPARAPEPEREPESEEDDEDEFATDDLESLGPRGEVRCSSMPFKKPKGPNKFKDDGKIPATFLGAGPKQLIEESRSMGKSTRLEEKKQEYRRPQKTLSMKCIRCSKQESVPEGIVSPDEFVCNSCSAAAGFRG